MNAAVVEAMAEVGLGRTDDFNGAQQEGAGLYQRFTRRGQRWTIWDGYLAPRRKQPNLTITPNALVHKVLIEGGRATGVVVRVGNEIQTIRAKREVVLSAGAYNTPHLLMLSGIGPADHLAEHGIDTVVDNPHVGAHLMDHPMYLANWDTSDKDNLGLAEKPAQLLKYFLKRQGMLTSNVGEAGGFFTTREGLAGYQRKIREAQKQKIPYMLVVLRTTAIILRPSRVAVPTKVLPARLVYPVLRPVAPG